MKKYTELTGTIFCGNKERLEIIRYGLSIETIFKLFHDVEDIEISKGLTNEIVITVVNREIILKQNKISNMEFGDGGWGNYLAYNEETLNNTKLETLKEEINYIIEKINSIAVEKITNIKFEILEK